MWQPIETAPMDQFLLLCGPSGYTTPPMVVTTGRMCSDYHAGRWIDHANDDLIDWGFEPTHWAPLIFPGAQPAQSVPGGWKLVPTAESRHPGIYKMLGALHVVDNTPGASEWESYAAMLAAAPEAKS